MKNLVLLLALSGLALACASQEAGSPADLGARIKADRAQVETIFRAEEKACYGKFAVNDCLNDARGRRRQALADLRRQEISLNDAERKRRAAERLRTIEERASPDGQRQDAQERDSAAAKHQRRDAQASRERADRAASEESRAAKAAGRKAAAEQNKATQNAQRTEAAAEAQRNLARHDERLKQAGQRKEKLEQRRAARKKPAAQPLPVPP
jgi:colicin import membrane protein